MFDEPGFPLWLGILLANFIGVCVIGFMGGDDRRVGTYDTTRRTM